MKKLISIFTTWVVLGLIFPWSCFAGYGYTVSGGGTVAASGCTSCTSSNDSTIVESPNTADTTYQANAWIAYQFTIASAICATGVYADINDGGTGYGATGEIWSDDAGTPNARYGDGYTAAVANLPDTSGAVEFLFAATQLLPAGTYWVVIKNDDVHSPHWGRDSVGGTGTFYYTSNQGTSWAISGYEYEFGVLGCTSS